MATVRSLWEPQTVGEAIRILRRRRGWSQGELAHRISDLGVPVSGAHVSRIEDGRRRAQVAHLLAVAEIFDVSLADLGVTDDDYPELDIIRKVAATRAKLHGHRERFLSVLSHHSSASPTQSAQAPRASPVERQLVH